jgi:hypothetical protein
MPTHTTATNKTHNEPPMHAVGNQQVTRIFIDFKNCIKNNNAFHVQLNKIIVQQFL